MRSRLRLLLALTAVSITTLLLWAYNPNPAPVGAAAYTGRAQIEGPLQLDVALSPPVAAPRDLVQLTAQIANRTAETATPTVTLQLPVNLHPYIDGLPRGATFNLQRNIVQWMPVVAPGGVQQLTLDLRVDTADLAQPEREVIATLFDGEREKQTAVALWLGLPAQLAGFGNPRQVAIGQPLQLKAEVVGPGPIEQTWYLGDGRSVQVKDPVVVYPAAGVYQLRVEVANPLGRVERTQEITVVPHVAAQFTPHDDTPSIGQPVAFQNQSGGQQPLRYRWQFGDGAVSDEAHPTHVYAAPGAYQVQLTVENEYGRSETTQTITVGQPPAAEMRVVESAPAGEWIVGEAISSDAATQFSWEMGDGRVYAGEKVSHTYRQSGNYYVTLVASNEFGETRVGRWLYVESGVLKSYLPFVSFATGLAESISADTSGVELPPEPVELEGTFTMDPLELPAGSSSAEQLTLYINAVRNLFELPPLTGAAELSLAAQKHVEDMAGYGHASHTGSDGSRPAERVAWHGYPHAYAGETTAVGFSDPREAVEFWINSPSHRAILLNPYATDLGVGYVQAYDAPGVWYWTAEFGNRFGAAQPPSLAAFAPENNATLLNSDLLLFSWKWPRPLAAGERFVVSVDDGELAVPVGVVTAPALGMRYELGVSALDYPQLLGELSWQVQLESGSGVIAASEARALTLNPDLDLITPTPLVTATLTPTLSVTPLPSVTPTMTQPAATATPPATQPPVIVTATPAPSLPIVTPTPEP